MTGWVASFTHRLRDPSNALHKWFAARLPNTPAVAKEANHALRGPANQITGQIVTLGRPRQPPQPCRARDDRLAGTALDLLLRATLRPRALEHAIGGRGSGRIVVGPGIPPAIGIELEALARIHALRPWEPDFREQRWREVAELCVLLARFEQASRSDHVVELARTRVATADPTLPGYISALADADVVDDVAAAAPAVAGDHADLRAVEPLRFGPTFALSRELGGADGDVIAGDLLLDFKASSSARIVGRHELWQLAGYALADTDDELGIRRVGISALRWRRRWTVSLDELLESLAGRPVEVGNLRGELAAVASGDSRLARPSPPL
jgi:hypothetical protein